MMMDDNEPTKLKPNKASYMTNSTFSGLTSDYFTPEAFLSQYKESFQDRRCTFREKRHTSVRKIYENIDQKKSIFLEQHLIRYQLLKQLLKDAIRRIQFINYKQKSVAIQKINYQSKQLDLFCHQIKQYLRQKSGNNQKHRRGKSLHKQSTDQNEFACKEYAKRIYYQPYFQYLLTLLLKLRNFQDSLRIIFEEAIKKDEIKFLASDLHSFISSHKRDQNKLILLLRQDPMLYGKTELENIFVDFCMLGNKEYADLRKQLKYHSEQKIIIENQLCDLEAKLKTDSVLSRFYRFRLIYGSLKDRI